MYFIILYPGPVHRHRYTDSANNVEADLSGAWLLKGGQILSLPLVGRRDLIRFNRIANMSNIATTSLRQASRLCLKQSAPSQGPLRRSVGSAVAAISNKRIGTRTYVSETKKDSAQVNVDTAIRADQKAFFKETGKLPEHQTMPGTMVNADAMMSPIAGMWLMSAYSVY
jgi:hypothetical protein